MRSGKHPFTELTRLGRRGSQPGARRETLCFCPLTARDMTMHAVKGGPREWCPLVPDALLHERRGQHSTWPTPASTRGACAPRRGTALRANLRPVGRAGRPRRGAHPSSALRGDAMPSTRKHRQPCAAVAHLQTRAVCAGSMALADDTVCGVCAEPSCYCSLKVPSFRLRFLVASAAVCSLISFHTHSVFFLVHRWCCITCSQYCL